MLLRSNINNKLLTFLTILVITCLAGCSTTVEYKPDYLDKNFNPSKFDHLTVLPAVDLRKDKSIKIENLSEEMFLFWEGKFATDDLAEKGYIVQFANNYGLVKSISEDDIEFPAEQWISNLGAKEDKLVLLPVLTDTARVVGFGSDVRIECKGILYEKKSNRKMWSHSHEVNLKGPGVAGILLDDTLPAIRICTLILIAQFPPRNDP